MTRKDYIRIAGALREARRVAVLDNAEARLLGISAAAVHIADALQRDNPRFDHRHFLAVVRGEKLLTSRP